MLVRIASIADIEDLLNLEEKCWQDNLRSTKNQILRRIALFPGGQFVLEGRGRLCGVLYTQRINSVHDLLLGGHSNHTKQLDPLGSIWQLIAINVDSDLAPNGGVLLREHVINIATQDPSVNRLVAVTRCAKYDSQRHGEYFPYVLTGKDPTIFFHLSGGAKVLRTAEKYRPEDDANLGNGVLIEYSLTRTFHEVSITAEDICEFICANFTDKSKIISPDVPFMNIIDSMQLLSLHVWIETKIKKSLTSDFLFRYTSALKVEESFRGENVKRENSSRNLKSIASPNHSDAIAITGIGMRFPGDIGNLSELWNCIENRKNLSTTIPKSRWYASHLMHQNETDAHHTGAQYGCFIKDEDKFDPSYFGLSEPEVENMDPNQRLLLECIAKAIVDSGQSLSSLEGSKTGVWIGASNGDYHDVPGAGFKNNDSVYSATGGALSMAAGRVSFLLGLIGPSMTIDTACSSSLVAIHQACSALKAGNCDEAIVAAVNLILSPWVSLSYDRAGMLSPDGKCKSFDASANGYCRGEGCGAITLKRVSDAIASGDKIYAIICGSSVMHHGRSASLTAPNSRVQEELLLDALRAASKVPASIKVLESHGTGTKLGDPVEIAAIANVFKSNACLNIGSVKANLGHLEAAAGMAGLFSAICCILEGKAPGNANLETINPKVSSIAESTGLSFPKTVIDLNVKPNDMVVGVSSFGYSGTIAHVILDGSQSTVGSLEQNSCTAFYEAYHARRIPYFASPAVDSDMNNGEVDLIKRYESSVDDHCIGDDIILAGAALLELTVAFAEKNLGESNSILLSNFMIKRSVNVSDLKRLGVASHLFVSYEEPTKLEYFVNDTDQRMSCCCTEISYPMQEIGLGDFINYKVPHDKKYDSLSPSLMYDEYFRRGLRFGPSYQVVKKLSIYENIEAMADICIDIAPEVTILPPQLIDSLFQIAGALAYFDSNNSDWRSEGLLVPFCVEKAVFNHPLLRSKGKEYQVFIKKRHLTSHNAMFDGKIAAMNGEVLVSLEGITMCRYKNQDPIESKELIQVARDEWVPYENSSWTPSFYSKVRLVFICYDENESDYAIIKRIINKLQSCGILATFAPNIFQFQAQKGDIIVYLNNVCRLRDAEDAVEDNALAKFLAILSEVATKSSQLIALELTSSEVSDFHSLQKTAFAGAISTFQLEHFDLKIQNVRFYLDDDEDCLDHIVQLFIDCLRRDDSDLLYRNGVTFRKALKQVGNGFSGFESCELTLSQRGSLDNLVLKRQMPLPAPQSEEVEVKIISIGLNFRDVLNVLGLYPGDPGNPGCEFAGIITRVGESVNEFSVGDRIVGFGTGCLRQLHIVSSRCIARLPRNLSFMEGAVLPVVYCTVELTLGQLAQLSHKDVVLIHAAAGGVGLAAVSYSLKIGAKVIATCSDGKRDYLRSLGVEHICSSRDSDDFREQVSEIVMKTGKVTVVLNSLSENFIDYSLEILASNGHFAEIGKRGILTKEEMHFKRKDVNYHIVALDDIATYESQKYQKILQEVCKKFDDGWWTKPFITSFSLFDQYRQGFELLRSGSSIGKIVLNTSFISSGHGANDHLKSVVVTGGYGGLGLEVLKSLVKLKIQHIFVIGRRATSNKESVLKELQDHSLCQIYFVDCDVRKENDVIEMLGFARRCAGSVNGVIHCAGILRDSLIRGNGASSGAKEVWDTKALGGWWFHKHTVNDKLSLFLLFSSIVSFIGREGQSAYSASNRFLDELSILRNENQLSGLSVRWPAINGSVGMASTNMMINTESWSIHLNDFKAILEEILVTKGCKLGPVLSVFPNSIGKILSHGKASQFKDILRIPIAPTLKLVQRLCSPRKRQSIVYTIRSVVERFVTVPLDQIDEETSLIESGLDSLAATEVSTLLSKAFSCKLPPTLLFNYSTIRALEMHIKAELGLVVNTVDDQETKSDNDSTDSPEESVSNEVDDLFSTSDDYIEGLVAIVGQSFILPGRINTIESLEAALEDKRVFTGPMTHNRWDTNKLLATSDYLFKKRSALQSINFGGFLEQDVLDEFQGSDYGITDMEANKMDLRQRLVLKITHGALTNAGYVVSEMRGKKVGVFVAALGHLKKSGSVTNADEEPLKPSIFDATSNSLSVTSGRVSFVFGFEGPNLSVDTACSSSLVALHLARRSLQFNECDLAVVIGVNIIDPDLSIAFALSGMLSADGRCHTFDESANGYCRGEGCAALVLQKTIDAQRDGRRIYATIKGSVVMQDGKSASLTAPSGLAQEHLIKAALDDANISPEDVFVIESHGTGTKLGDPIEIEAIAKAYGDRPIEKPLYISGLKANFGHLEAAAGMIGILSAVATISTGKVHPNAGLQALNPSISRTVDGLPIIFPQETVNLDSEAIRDRHAAVSSFGYSGTIAHVILGPCPRSDFYSESLKEKTSAGKYRAITHAVEVEIIDVADKKIPPTQTNNIVDHPWASSTQSELRTQDRIVLWDIAAQNKVAESSGVMNFYLQVLLEQTFSGAFFNFDEGHLKTEDPVCALLVDWKTTDSKLCGFSSSSIEAKRFSVFRGRGESEIEEIGVGAVATFRLLTTNEFESFERDSSKRYESVRSAAAAALVPEELYKVTSLEFCLEISELICSFEWTANEVESGLSHHLVVPPFAGDCITQLTATLYQLLYPSKALGQKLVLQSIETSILSMPWYLDKTRSSGHRAILRVVEYSEDSLAVNVCFVDVDDFVLLTLKGARFAVASTPTAAERAPSEAAAEDGFERTSNKLKGIVSKTREIVFGIVGESDSFDEEQSLEACGFDSLLATELVNQLNDEFDVDMQSALGVMKHKPSLKEIIEVVLQQVKFAEELVETATKSHLGGAQYQGNPWFSSYFSERPSARLVIFGGLAHPVISWHKFIQPFLQLGVNVHIVRLPGRLERFQEDSLPEFADYVHGVCEALRDLGWLNDLPLAFLGYSFGSSLAYGCAQFLENAWDQKVSHLVMLGGPTREAYSHIKFMRPEDRTMKGFLDFHVDNLGRVNPLLDLNTSYLPSILALILEVFHRDQALAKSWMRYYDAIPKEKRQLNAHILSVSGMNDIIHRSGNWMDHAKNSYEQIQFPGDHFFVYHDEKLDLEVVTEIVHSVMRGIKMMVGSGSGSAVC